jgi:hypothetical protein
LNVLLAMMGHGEFITMTSTMTELLSEVYFYH